MAMAAVEPLVAPQRRIGRGLRPSDHRALLVGGDVVALVLAVVVSLWTWSITAGFPFSAGFVLSRAVWFLSAPAWLAVLFPLYDLRAALSIGRTARGLAHAVGVLLAIYLAIYFYAPRSELPRLVALYIVWEGALLTLAWRLSYIWFIANGPFDKQVAIVGVSDAGRAVHELLCDAAAVRTTVAGFVDDEPAHWGAVIEGTAVLGGSDCLPEMVERLGISEIVLTEPHQTSSTLVAALAECQVKGVDIVPMSQVYEDVLRRVPVAHLPSSWLFTSLVEAVRFKDASWLAKRGLDLAGAAAGMIVLVLLAPLIGLAIRLDSGGAVFYRQVRVGRGGRLFNLLKFRTMVDNAEDDGVPQWTRPDDPRITRVGRWLRRTRLDELPNLWNILKGDMSLVGPRPERPEFVEVLQRRVPFYRARLMVRPGLTGWAQINHPYGDSVSGAQEKLEYDLYYVKHRSLLFDVQILARTVGTVIRLRGR